MPVLLSQTRIPTIGEQENLPAIGVVDWQSPSLITAEDGNCTYIQGVAYDSHWIRGRAYGFSLPGHAVVKGIEVQFKYRAQTDYGAGGRSSLVLGDSGVLSGTWYKDNAASWFGGSTLPSTFLEMVVGGPTDTWGPAMTPAQVNGAGFCAGVECTHDAGGGNSRVECDTLRVKVYYEVPASGDFSEF